MEFEIESFVHIMSASGGELGRNYYQKEIHVDQATAVREIGVSRHHGNPPHWNHDSMLPWNHECMVQKG